MKQNSYVRISDSIHPNTSLATRFKSNINTPDEEDYFIVDEIININKIIGSKDPGGAWKYGSSSNLVGQFFDKYSISRWPC